MVDALEALGARVQAIRQNLGISQEELAGRCGFDRTYISMVERGKRNISFYNLLRLARGLNVSVSKLTEGLDDAPNTNQP